MALHAGCPWCTTPVAPADEDAWSCPEHGLVPPLWRPTAPSYDSFVEHLDRAGPFPTYLPWPLGPEWHISDFALVGTGSIRATLTCVSGATALDGPVDVIVISEEPGTGLGARVIGMTDRDRDAFEAAVAGGPPEVKVRLSSHAVGLWPVPILRQQEGSEEWDRSVLLGEAEGRWLWLVLRPASALLLLREEWILRDVSDSGPQLVEVPFGGQPGTW